MDYRKDKDDIYIRIDKGENVLETIKNICRKERVEAAYFQGIGACSTAILSTWIPKKEDFIHHTITGMLEMISLMGNISTDNDGNPFTHSHAVFSYLKDSGEIIVTAGHLEEAEISYTGEVILTKATKKIGRIFDANAGIEVWKL